MKSMHCSKPPHASFLRLGIALALFFASNGVEAIRVALNRAYRTRDDRWFLYCRLQSLFFVIAGGELNAAILEYRSRDKS